MFWEQIPKKHHNLLFLMRRDELCICVYNFMVNRKYCILFHNLAFMSYNHLIFNKMALFWKSQLIFSQSKRFLVADYLLIRQKKFFHFVTLQDCFCQMSVIQEKDLFFSRINLHYLCISDS